MPHAHRSDLARKRTSHSTTDVVCYGQDPVRARRTQPRFQAFKNIQAFAQNFFTRRSGRTPSWSCQVRCGGIRMSSASPRHLAMVPLRFPPLPRQMPGPPRYISQIGCKHESGVRPLGMAQPSGSRQDRIRWAGFFVRSRANGRKGVIGTTALCR